MYIAQYLITYLLNFEEAPSFLKMYIIRSTYVYTDMYVDCEYGLRNTPWHFRRIEQICMYIDRSKKIQFFKQPPYTQAGFDLTTHTYARVSSVSGGGNTMPPGL
jgi:hypothetical protein